MCAEIQYISHQILDSIVVSIPACHAGDRGSIPRRGDFLFFISHLYYTNDRCTGILTSDFMPI